MEGQSLDHPIAPALAWGPPADGDPPASKPSLGIDVDLPLGASPPAPPRRISTNALAPATRGVAWPGQDGWWPEAEDSSTDVPPPLAFGQPQPLRSPGVVGRPDDGLVAIDVAALSGSADVSSPGRVLALVAVLAVVALGLVALAMHPWAHDPPPPSRTACSAAPTEDPDRC